MGGGIENPSQHKSHDFDDLNNFDFDNDIDQIDEEVDHDVELLTILRSSKDDDDDDDDKSGAVLELGLGIGDPWEPNRS